MLRKKIKATSWPGDGIFPVLKGRGGKVCRGPGQRSHSAMGPTGPSHLVGNRASAFRRVGWKVGREIENRTRDSRHSSWAVLPFDPSLACYTSGFLLLVRGRWRPRLSWFP